MNSEEMIEFLKRKRNGFEFTHHVIVNEEGKSLYRDITFQEIVAELDQYNGRMLRVISQRMINGELYYLLERSNEILGWYHAEDSIELYKKKTEMVRVDLERYETPVLHDIMNIKGDMNLAFRDRRLVSMFYAIHGGELHEALYANKRFVGWCRTELLEKAWAVGEKSLLTLNKVDEYTVFRNSQMKNSVNWHFDASEPVEVTAYFPLSKIFKVKQENREGWIQEENDDVLNQLIENGGGETTIEDILFEDLLLNIERERKQSKNNMIKLLKESLEYQKEMEKLKARLDRVAQLYSNLKNSKLGKIQTKIWERKKKRSKG
ncbi:hypothetical protein [Salinicoccus roseus]|uniref:hypothetical protein n=1 Tax=Salinicoccus roseus TaxID=45670 RepID=UPI0023015C5C|nr:hypothetical protein [Salinicoccus roseus]